MTDFVKYSGRSFLFIEVLRDGFIEVSVRVAAVSKRYLIFFIMGLSHFYHYEPQRGNLVNLENQIATPACR